MGEHAPARPGPFAWRRSRLRARMAAADLDALLVTHLPNVRYLSGFSGSYGALVLLAERDVLVTDGRYEQQAGAEAPGVEVTLAAGDAVAGAAKLLAAGPAGAVGFEPAGLTWAAGTSLQELLPGARPAPPLVEALRVVKDETEIACIRAAAEAGTAAFAELLDGLRPRVTERELAWSLEAGLRRCGADGPAFDPIVAFGEQSAEPHHHPNERALARGDLVKLDFGASVGGYRSDMTRTLVLGPVSPRQRELYELVRLAQASGLATLRPGVTGDEVDRACRGVVEAAGFGPAFSHPTGHGVGLEIHEAPRVRAGAGDSIAAGTPLTVEPGVYIPGFGGVRIEDLAIVRPGGHELLTTATKDLLVL